jgi:hypothetical protein
MIKPLRLVGQGGQFRPGFGSVLRGKSGAVGRYRFGDNSLASGFRWVRSAL